MSYKVLFIDEESIQHDDFKEHFEENWPEAECECVFPARTIEEMLELLEKTHPDAVIVDYQLNDKKVDILLIRMIKETGEIFEYEPISFDQAKEMMLKLAT